MNWLLIIMSLLMLVGLLVQIPWPVWIAIIIVLIIGRNK